MSIRSVSSSPVDLQHPQTSGAHGDDRDGVGVTGIWFAVVAGVEEPDPDSEHHWNVDHMLAGLEQSLRQRSPDSVRGRHGPDRIGPRLGVVRTTL